MYPIRLAGSTHQAAPSHEAPTLKLDRIACAVLRHTNSHEPVRALQKLYHPRHEVQLQKALGRIRCWSEAYSEDHHGVRPRQTAAAPAVVVATSLTPRLPGWWLVL